MTPAGEEMKASAERMEEEAEALERRIVGRDASLSGVLRVTMAHPLATHLLAPDLAAFLEKYPGIELEVAVSYQHFDLTKREADVAIRLTNNPPTPPAPILAIFIRPPPSGGCTSPPRRRESR
jgi:DNA-binding transcriptional LysR family regulator